MSPDPNSFNVSILPYVSEITTHFNVLFASFIILEAVFRISFTGGLLIY